VRFISLALLLFAISDTAAAQLAPQRTWPELKEAVQERANRNAYPMTGMKSEDVREILSQINSLDRDEWAAAWSRMGERYQTRAAEQERTDPKAASESFLVAFRYFAFGGWPTQNSVGKKAAFENSVAAFRKHASNTCASRMMERRYARISPCRREYGRRRSCLRSAASIPTRSTGASAPRSF
jgi:hypothetical protein